MSEFNNMNTNTPLDWDSEISAESSFVLLPEGEYPFKIITFERGYHNGSDKLPACNKAELKIEIDGGEHGTVTVNHNLFIHRKCEGLLCEFFIAIGEKKHGKPLKMNWTVVPGATGRCKVGIREYKGNQYNEIKKFIEPSASTQQKGFTAGSF